MVRNADRVSSTGRIKPPLEIDASDVEWVWSGTISQEVSSPPAQLLEGVFAALSHWVRTGEIAVLYSFKEPLLRFWVDRLGSQQFALHRETIDAERFDNTLQQWKLRPTGLNFVVMEVAHFDVTRHPAPDLFAYDEAKSIWNRCNLLFVWYLPQQSGCVVAEFNDRVGNAAFQALYGAKHPHGLESYLDSLFEAAAQWLGRRTKEQGDQRYLWLTEQSIVPITPIPEAGEI